MARLRGQICRVTGAVGAIGAGIARVLVGEGAQRVLSDGREDDGNVVPPASTAD
jgi:NAD(P)-dependent dehydrogenase (short-subunit alcohol dehydrogenase family)